MPRKGENIYKRKDGRWEARYIKSIGANGRARYGSCYGRTYSEAKGKAEQMKANLLTGYSPIRTSADKRRFDSFCDEWLRMMKNNVKPSTYAQYTAVLENYIRPQLGSYLPLDISSKTVDEFKEELLAESNLAPKTTKDILVIFRSILKYTAKQFPGGFPSVDISYPKQFRKETRILSIEEQQRFMAYLTHSMDPCRFGILLALLTGLRIGELCALRWGNISLSNGTLQVTATVQRLPNQSGSTKTKVVIGVPKSEMSARTIPLSDFVVQLCRQIGPGCSFDFVLTGTEHCMEPRTLQYRLKKYTQECGLDGVHFHTLRHTFATRCVEVGFEIKSLSEILGHANTSITMDLYVHSSMELKRKNMEKLSEIF